MHSKGDNEVHAFPKGINPKVDPIARLKFELVYSDVTSQGRQSLRHEVSLGLVWIDLVSLFNGISTVVGHLMPKSLLKKNSSDTHHHHQVTLTALSSLALSHHPSLWSIAPGRSSRLHQ